MYTDDSLTTLATHHAANPELAHTHVRDVLRDIRERDAEIGAFVHLAEPDALCRDAASLAGPLAGIPVGVKDIFDTRDLPTQYGCPAIYPAQACRVDAALIGSLQRAGAFIVGKTATTELAFLDPAATRNPKAPGRTPGGSSSGSVAAVAAGLVPLAVGSQTGGSTIRPASYCGIVGYKPTASWLPTGGMKCFSWSLDTVGLFSRTIADMVVFAQALTGRALNAPSPTTGRARVVAVPVAYPWGAASASASAAVERAARDLERLGFEIRRVHFPAVAAAAFDAHGDVQGFEAATALRYEFGEHRERLSPLIRDYLTSAMAIDAAAYEKANLVAATARRELTEWLGDCEALLLPSAPDEPPEGYSSTGPSTFNRLLTLLGWPCVNVPGLTGAHGAPMGVQLAGPWGTDARVLGVAGELERMLAMPAGR